MMGSKARLFTPVSARSLDELVPVAHFYRQVDRVLDLSFVRALVQDCYTGGTGRPSIDPVVFFKLARVVFFEGIRSERQLLRLAADRLSVRWYLGDNPDEPLPDHSSLTRIRTRYGLEVFRRFFEVIVEQCQRAGLVWGKGRYLDATQVQADAALDSLTARFAVDARQARREARAALRAQQTDQARQAVEAHLSALFSNADPLDPRGQEQPPERNRVGGVSEAVPEAPEAATAEAAAAVGERTGTSEPPVPTPLPAALPVALCEELAATNAARHDWIAQEGRQQRGAHGYYQRTADLRISATDPDATPLRLKGGGTHLGYQTHYVVDGGGRRIILGVLVTPGEVTENHPMLDLAWRVRFRWKLRPRQVTGDSKYGTGEDLQALEAMGLRAYIPVPEWEPARPYLGLGRFTYDDARDVYVCPQGQLLRFLHTDYATQRVAYQAPAAACNACPVKAQCTPSDHGRRVHRSFYAESIERVRAYRQTPAYEKALRKRQGWVEPLFAEAKEWHGLRRFRLRRLWRVNCEALLIATGQNLKRLLSSQGWGRRPLPSGAALAVNPFHEAWVCIMEILIPPDARHWSDDAASETGQSLLAA